MVAVVLVNEGEIAIEGRSGAPLTGGELIVISDPGLHRFAPLRPSSVLVAELMLSSMRLTPAAARAAHLARGPEDGPLAALVAATVKELATATGRLGEDDVRALATVLHTCLACIVRSAASVHGVSHKARQFQRAAQYIQDELTDSRLSPTRVANHLGTSLRYLQVLFSDNGESVAAYIRAARLDQCRREVIARDLPIATIAGLYGFADASHFSRLFRERFGCTPLQERRRAAQVHVTK